MHIKNLDLHAFRAICTIKKHCNSCKSCKSSSWCRPFSSLGTKQSKLFTQKNIKGSPTSWFVTGSLLLQTHWSAESLDCFTTLVKRYKGRRGSQYPAGTMWQEVLRRAGACSSRLSWTCIWCGGSKPPPYDLRNYVGVRGRLCNISPPLIRGWPKSPHSQKISLRVGAALPYSSYQISVIPIL